MTDRKKDKLPESSREICSEAVSWSSEQVMRSSQDRRQGLDRRAYYGRAMTVPDMRAPDLRQGADRRSGQDRRVKLVITGRAVEA